jgi:hypothetical protein
MILNLLHRPEKPQHDPLFHWQQKIAHDLGLKVTIFVDFDNLKRPEIVESIKGYWRDFGDEVGFWFSHPGGVLESPDNSGLEPFLWLYSTPEKEAIIRKCLETFRATFGFYPTSVGSYHMDAVSLQLLKEISPETQVTIAGCFEEGVRVFHGCNHSWYLFNEGGPWWPWYPSKGHSLRPASSAADAVDIVAVPHLIRDLVLSYEGRNDFFASHPQNIQRAMANNGPEHPYDFNLLLQHQLQEDFNNGYSWVHVFVGPNWLSGNHNIEDSDEVTQGIYRDYLEHFAAMKSRGELQDMHMTEFGGWFKQHRPLEEPTVALAKDVLYGSGKHYFWYVDGQMRVTVDAQQGGSIGDLRPYVAGYSAHTGTDSKRLAIGSYPYLVHSQHRTGHPNHSRDGSRTTAIVEYGGSSVDLCGIKTKVAVVERGVYGTLVKFIPSRLEFPNASAELQSAYFFHKNGRIELRRTLTSDAPGSFKLTEYVKGCYGFTEYPEDMKGIGLEARGDTVERLEYNYKGRKSTVSNGRSVTARVPQIGAGLSLEAHTRPAKLGYVEEGYIFNPFYTLALTYEVQREEELVSVLSVFAV